jgi:signal transduction histidine kinase
MKRKILFIASYVFVITIIRFIYINNIDRQKSHFIEKHKFEAREVQEKVQHHLQLIYQGLRTISRIPAVKNLEMNNPKLSPEMTKTLQEIYNNLKLSIHVSEIYIVPINFEPDQIDALTHQLQEPKITFDLIKENIPDNEVKKYNPDEVEIFEYRIMRHQNSVFKNKYPNSRYINGFDVPLLSSKEVITCDNSHFDIKHPDDKKRSGQVFSVPFYSHEGKLKGIVSGIVLTGVLADYLPANNFQIVSAENDYQVGSPPASSEELIYKDNLKLDFNGPEADWQLISTVQKSQFLADREVIFVNYMFYLSLVLATAFTCIAYFMNEQNTKLITSQQKAIESSAKLALMGEMTAGIAHEINNPLALLVMKMTMISAMNEKGTLTKERITADISKMQSTADRIVKIIKGLKSLSRNDEADPFAQISIKKIIEDSLIFCTDRLVERGIELKLVNNLEDMVSCREVQLSQVIINLVNNASDAIIELPEKWVEIEVSKMDNRLTVTITDSGKGIPPEIAKKLMTAFFSTKGVGKGTGLGLSISQRIVHEHGGELRLDQAYHHTRFVIELPV